MASSALSALRSEASSSSGADVASTTSNPRSWTSPESLCRSWEGEHVVSEFLVPNGSPGEGLGALMTDELGEQLVASHSDESMDGVHGSPFSGVAQRARPGKGVKIVGVAQRSVDVEEHARPKVVRHAGGSCRRLASAWASPVRWSPRPSGDPGSSDPLGSGDLRAFRRASSTAWSRCSPTHHVYPVQRTVNRLLNDVA